MKDRIEKQIILKASQTRVWSALADVKQFGAWFGLEIDRPWEAGAKVSAIIRPTQVDPRVADSQLPHDGKPFDLTVDRIEPEQLFSFRWKPHAIYESIDSSKLPLTLVTFELSQVTGGTLLKITESGFDQMPLECRAKAFAMNQGAWDVQTRLIRKFLSLPPPAGRGADKSVIAQMIIAV